MEGDKKAAAAAMAEEAVVEQKTKAAAAAAAGDVSLKELSKRLNDFAKERDWEQYHSPRNLLLAMIAEVGELSELFMWKGEVRKGLADWDEAEKEHLGEELSDVLLYLIRLSDMCGVDLGDAATRKIVKNAVKYPAPSKEGA
ncbi:hypothetical protein BDA96_06G162900 [Sorghum bicolor]|uniref:dCTP pyrophosphatase 1 n=2 Tax=Sorghum bicolor TaxID=4558 RepID=A0A921QR99_SORBI|nr:dCTP pyrophosphatase 1 [Sorghum bicolor]EES11113.1 hypothetical protein SORBI_3006G147200 [Sorghum bicolor]KAG0526639.1 hypothetical protein BDA96_06G162900 [Sorghum bicolor]|eukprot:XP_002446785.1 dCTP pyrophosphatase 1 [Sorghum bicolor]